jgi:hypothetical protein
MVEDMVHHASDFLCAMSMIGTSRLFSGSAAIGIRVAIHG